MLSATAKTMNIPLSVFRIHLSIYNEHHNDKDDFL